MPNAREDLIEFLTAELSKPVPGLVGELAEAVRARHGKAVAGVLFYGSCLRQVEGALGDGLLDFYLLVDGYREAYGGRALPALANAILPPNVFYLETSLGNVRLRCKYAIMSLSAFKRACGPHAWNVSVWARFSQPSRLLWARGPMERAEIASACAQAVLTMIRNAPNASGPKSDSVTLWQGALERTYGAELRSEGRARAREIVTADEARYRALTPLAMAALRDAGVSQGAASGSLAWLGRRCLGKVLNALRLVKAAFTFDGGLDYILWKVKRHSGVEIPVSDWQRRHPLLSAPAIAWRLYRRGAFR
jgi:hypothetical protein